MSIKAFAPSLIALMLAGSTAFAASAQGPEPYSAPTPSYKPMSQEPMIAKEAASPATFGNADSIKGPDAGPEPYSAPTPVYKPMTSEPTIQPQKTSAPKL